VPLHPVDRVEFQGALGLPEGELRRLVTDRFGTSPRAGRAAEMVEALRQEYRRRGYTGATIGTRVVETHEPDRATLFFDVNAGRRLSIIDVRFTQVDADEQATVAERPDIRRGEPLDEDAMLRALRAWEEGFHAQGYYEARASHGALITEDGAVVTVNLARGPRVVVRFTGDPLGEADRDRLVPIRAEGSADEDLLEDSSRAIENYLRERGYRDADAFYEREEREGELVITFQVDRGPHYVVREVRLTGNSAIPTPELRALVALEPGGPFVRSVVAEGVGAIERLYRSRGFTRAQVKAGEAVIVPERASDPDRPTDVQLEIEEGPRTVVRSVAFEGYQAIDEATLRGLTSVASGQPFSEAAIITDRERIDLEYRNRGYDSVVVDYASTLGEGDTQADIVYAITEGQRITVDHIIIVGNRRISAATIERELLLREGEPLGYTALVESRARLQALGLFRRSQITPVAHGGEPRRDLVVEVEEVPPTIFDFGPGVEGGFVLRTDEAGLAEERFELAPRGSIQIGRRNLWGKNRTATLFTRVSLRSRDVSTEDPSTPEPVMESRFYEYRVVGQFREPRVFETAADVLVTGIIEQAKRSSFNFSRREARAEGGMRISRTFTAVGVYSFQRTKLFDERFTAEEQPLIDRLFPEVRLSKVSGSLIRDTRDDPFDASRGTLTVVDGELAARAFGSEVGFVQTYVQSYYYRQLPVPRRVVLALGARLGAAHGFPRDVDGQIVQDLPASERFFAGGDTSVRGFTLDRLGNERTTTASGFPTGGNSVVVLNSELRVTVLGALQAVGFLDAGNVFPRASDLDLTDLRPAAGVGLMYNIPGVGPVRVDLGFNLDPRELVPGTLERRSVLHILLGQAF
jgi:outer membrane protein assembly complex protein YaeT